MQVIRFPSFAKNAARRQFKLASVIAMPGGILLLIGLVYPAFRMICWTGGLFASVMALKCATAALGPWIGDHGEDRVEEELAQLDDRYILIRNWVPLQGTTSAGDIDFVLLGPFGALVIEVKTYTRPTKCENDRWWVQRENGSWRPIKNLSWQLEKNKRRVSKSLNQAVSGVLVFNDRADLRVGFSASKIIRRRELLGLVAQMPHQNLDAASMWRQLSGE